MNLERFNNTIAAFDKENAKDPHKEIVDGKEYPKELLYGQRMSQCLNELTPNAPEALQLAARCQHIRRWEIPRESYPMDRKGYLQWRSKLKDVHAQIASEIMATNGYDEGTIKEVEDLLKKRRLKTDPEVQLLEDVACLVFLKYYFSEFAPKHDDEKIKSILLKTMNKMSKKGIANATKLENAGEFLKYVQ